MVEDRPMTNAESIAWWLRNSYKQRAYAIKSLLLSHSNLEASHPLSPSQSPLSPPPGDDDVEDDDEEEDYDDNDDEEVPYCPRYDEIKAYLTSRRKDLAIDTMKFRMPEHTFHKYIRRNGGIALSAEEWRGFLLNCLEREELFQ